ncbi:MAG: 3-deoxy-D-manno-octulosonic acid transferase [Deltaproteobacteria bacterium]|nr:3-deoxy-D-manno-octulosonic acid transferase [Deltaproteobacteria bacterium]
MMFLYHFMWAFPLFFLVTVASFSGSKRLRERLSLDLPKGLPKKGNLWVHALSVGEVLSAVPLVAKLKGAFPEKDIVLSVTTRSGMALASEKFSGQVACIMTLPLDAWWCTRRMINCVRPSVFILVETDLWPGLLGFLKQKGVRSLLVNGRISPRTLKSYKKAPGVVRRMFAPLAYCLMQTDLDRDRLLQLGMAREKVITTGNIKFDREMFTMDAHKKGEWLETLGLKPEMQLWVAGSTHEGEEIVLLRVFQDLKREFPLLRLIVAPRDVGRSYEISRMIRNQGMAVALRTTVSKKSHPYDVLVLDTVGELGYVYGLGSTAFVGGSFVPIGGHNLLEPAHWGIPVLFGPHTHNFELMSESILKTGGGFRVQDGAELYDVMERLLSDSALRERMGGRAKSFVVENRGALERVMGYIEHIRSANRVG